MITLNEMTQKTWEEMFGLVYDRNPKLVRRYMRANYRSTTITLTVRLLITVYGDRYSMLRLRTAAEILVDTLEWHVTAKDLNN